eukprot:117590_1
MSDENMSSQQLRRRKIRRDDSQAFTSGTDTVSGFESELDEKSKPQPAAGSAWMKAWTRIWTSVVMIVGFLMIIYGGHMPLCLLVATLQALMFREIVNIGARRRVEKNLPGFNLLHWYWFFCTLFFMYGRAMMDQIAIQGILRENILAITKYHSFISFALFTSGFVSFVLSLKKGYYRYQFKQLGWCFITILIIVVQSTFILYNIFFGMIWLVLPALLIICNDSAAWFFGILFGRTPLILLSPKKTWEGLIGGTGATIVMSFVLASYFQQFNFFICPKTGFDFTWVECTPDPMFVQFPVSSWPGLNEALETIGLSNWNSFSFSAFQMHSVVIGLFASIIAPFGGFFASGFKRAFRIKDFGDSIPGHGGITDRMDCQILMGLFVYVYTTAFARSKSVDTHYLLSLYDQLSPEEQLDFASHICPGTVG